jgi:hypothetical protein
VPRAIFKRHTTAAYFRVGDNPPRIIHTSASALRTPLASTAGAHLTEFRVGVTLLGFAHYSYRSATRGLTRIARVAGR